MMTTTTTTSERSYYDHLLQASCPGVYTVSLLSSAVLVRYLVRIDLQAPPCNLCFRVCRYQRGLIEVGVLHLNV